MTRTKQTGSKSAGGKARARAAGCVDADPDLLAAFGALLGAVPKELLERIIPPERAVMLQLVSTGARAGLAAVRPAATVKARASLQGAVFGITALAGRLRDMLSWCRITALHIQNADIKPADMKHLVGVLGKCGSLAHLDFADSNLGDEGAERLARVLSRCASLTHLILRFCRIGDRGAQKLAGVLGKGACPSLAYLDLSYNEIHPEVEENLRDCGTRAEIVLDFQILVDTDADEFYSDDYDYLPYGPD